MLFKHKLYALSYKYEVCASYRFSFFQIDRKLQEVYEQYTHFKKTDSIGPLEVIQVRVIFWFKLPFILGTAMMKHV